MSSSAALTGGTNDVNPQFMKVRVTSSSTTANTVTSVAVPIPVQRLATGGRAQVLEILKVYYDVNETAATETALHFQYTICLSSRSNGTTIPALGNADPYTVLFKNSCISMPVVSSLLQDCQCIDLTDGAGHGILFGMDNLYVLFQWNSTVAAGSAVNASSAPYCNLNIAYRWKNVGFSEYVGMVTSS